MSPSVQLASYFVAATLLSSGLTYLLVRSRVRLRLVAEPRSDRWHGTPTPNTGGVAILIACCVCYCLLASYRYWVIAACAGFIAILGFLDDRVQLPPLPKFIGQSFAVVIVIASGVVLRVTPWEWANLIITFLWIAGITNAFNLIDNMDGLCAGVAAIVGLSGCYLAILNHDFDRAMLLVVLVGAIVGFLVFNHKPARIFMGDCGSMFIGFSLGTLAITYPVSQTPISVPSLFYPLLAFMYPIFDTVLVSVARRIAGKPISVGGRDHSSHRLVSLGLTERRAVWLLWLLTAICALVGPLTYAFLIGFFAIALFLIIGATVFGIFLATLPDYSVPSTSPVRAKWVRQLAPNLRAAGTLVVDILLAGVALHTAYIIRWGDGFTGSRMEQFLVLLPIFMGLHAMSSVGFRTFDSGWRWFGAKDIFALSCSTVATSVSSIVALWILDIRDYSRGVIVLYAFLLLAITAGARFSIRALWYALATLGSKKAAVLSVNDTAERVVLVLQRNR